MLQREGDCIIEREQRSLRIVVRLLQLTEQCGRPYNRERKENRK